MTLKEIIAKGEPVTKENVIQGLHDSIAEANRLQKEAESKGDLEEAQMQAGYAAGCRFLLTMYEKTKEGQDLEGKEAEAAQTFAEISKEKLGELQ